MTAENTELEQLNVRLDPALIQRARMYCFANGHKIQWLVGVALEEFLDRNEPSQRRTTKR
jgi:hypothetical protein